MSSQRALAAAVGLLTFACLALFTPQINSVQVTTRLGLTLAIVEAGTLSIDRIAHKTIDKALVNGHYYSDKAPGLSLLAVPPVWVTKAVLRAMKVESWGLKKRPFRLYARVATLATVALPASLAVALVFLLALKFGATVQGALFGSLVLAIGSPFFFWSTAFFAHSLTGSLLVFVLALAHDPSRWSLGRGLLVGLLTGAAATIDLVGGLAVGLGGVVLLAVTWRPTRVADLRFGAGLIVGVAVGVVPLLIYNTHVFGSPFHLGYSNVVGFEGMKTGFFGIGAPQAHVLWEILFGGFRGLLPLAPVLILAPVGLFGLIRSARARAAGLAIAAVTILFLLINSGYYYWDGGSSAGPRHIVPALPLLCIAVAFAWPRSGWAQAPVLLMAAYGAFMAALVAATTVVPLAKFKAPLFEIYIPAIPSRALEMAPMALAWIVAAHLIWRFRPNQAALA